MTDSDADRLKPLDLQPDSVERIMRIKPAYDCIRVKPCVHGSDKCTNGPRQSSHGIHNAELHMTVRGPLAEITLAIGTGWDLPTVPTSARSAVILGRKPNGQYVEFHTAAPWYEGQRRINPSKYEDDACHIWEHCYVDRGYLMADPPVQMLVAQGSDAVWEWLESHYREALLDMEIVAERKEKK